MLGSGWTPSWGNSKNWDFQRLPINSSVTLMSLTYAGTPLTSETISGEQVHWFEDFWNRKSYSSGPFCTTFIQTACREMDGVLNLTQGCFYFSPSLKSKTLQYKIMFQHWEEHEYEGNQRLHQRGNYKQGLMLSWRWFPWSLDRRHWIVLLWKICDIIHTFRHLGSSTQQVKLRLSWKHKTG